MSMKRLFSGILPLGLILLFTEAFALQVVLSPSSTAIITNPSDSLETRMLVRYAVPEFLGTADIIYAQLTGKVDVTTCDRPAVEMEAIPVMSAWDAGTVSWSSPWRSPGGDLDESKRGSFVVRDGRRSIRIDVTDVVREWAMGERWNMGLMLRAASSFGGHFSPSEVAGDGGQPLAQPTIRVWYLPEAR